MGKATFVTTRLLAPLGALLGYWRPKGFPQARPAVSSAPIGAHAGTRPSCAGASSICIPAAERRLKTTPPARPLKVVRIRDHHNGTLHAGRLVISGRMADVCAELDRLANAHPGLLH